MDNKVYISVNSLTADSSSHVSKGHLDKILADSVIADIAVRCVICEEHTSMNLHDCRARGTFVCDKCKAAIMHIRNTFENT